MTTNRKLVFSKCPTLFVGLLSKTVVIFYRELILFESSQQKYRAWDYILPKSSECKQIINCLFRFFVLKSRKVHTLTSFSYPQFLLIWCLNTKVSIDELIVAFCTGNQATKSKHGIMFDWYQFIKGISEPLLIY
jgi:hypothetical protein